jgi:cytochrome P450/NADPH-cytochrome P450 reductase
MYVLYGSNTGSCESFAQKIATTASSYGGFPAPSFQFRSLFNPAGFTAKMGSLDSAASNMPKDGPVVIITASYEDIAHLDLHH